MPKECRLSLIRMLPASSRLAPNVAHSFSLTGLSTAALVGVFLIAAMSIDPVITQAQSNPLSDESLSEGQVVQKQVVQKIDAAVLARSNNIASYTVREQYSVFRNGETDPSAQELVQTKYTQSDGKSYTPISQSGSGMLRSVIIDKILAGEREMTQPVNRESAWITSANYEMHPEPTPVEINGRTCVVVDLKPKRKSPHLINGQAWFDSTDYTIVRLKGVPSQSPSVFAGEATVTRDYEKIDGFSMATHAEAHSHSLLLGDTLLKIDYTDYKISRKLDSASAVQTWQYRPGSTDPVVQARSTGPVVQAPAP